jgi:putative ABC transport system substrate-binding protein
MKRRELIAGLGSAAAWPLAAGARQQTKPTIGWLDEVEGFRQGLAQAGISVGRDLTVDYPTVDGNRERLSALAADLVAPGVAAIIAATGISALAAKAAGHTNHFLRVIIRSSLA